MPRPDYVIPNGMFYCDRSARGIEGVDHLYVGDGQTRFSDLEPISLLPPYPEDEQEYVLKNGKWVIHEEGEGGGSGGDPLVVLGDGSALPIPNLQPGVEIPWPELWNGRRVYRKLQLVNGSGTSYITIPLSTWGLNAGDLDFLGVDYTYSYISHKSGANAGYVAHFPADESTGTSYRISLRLLPNRDLQVYCGSVVPLQNLDLYITLFYTKKADPVFEQFAFMGGDSNFYIRGPQGRDGIVLEALNETNEALYLKEALPNVGTIEMVFSDTPNPGTLICDGSVVLREDYPELFQHLTDIDPAYEVLDGVSFQLPDMRGMFLRGLDPSGDIDEVRNIGSRQWGTFLGFDGHRYVANATVNVDTNPARGLDYRAYNADKYQGDKPGAQRAWLGVGATQMSTVEAYPHLHGYSRPSNIAVNFCIRYKAYEIAKAALTGITPEVINAVLAALPSVPPADGNYYALKDGVYQRFIHTEEDQ